MDDLLMKVFDLFKDYDIGIIGSAITNPEGAKDIDVLFLVKEDFECACAQNGKKWNGWDAWNGHVRIANLPRFGTKIQLIHVSSVDSFDKHPHCVLKRDGSFEKEGKFFVKPEGWKYEKFPKDLSQFGVKQDGD
jgi:hypothetical protein